MRMYMYHKRNLHQRGEKWQCHMGENPSQLSFFKAVPLQEVTTTNLQQQPASYKVVSYPLPQQGGIEEPPVKRGKNENISPAEVSENIPEDIIDDFFYPMN